MLRLLRSIADNLEVEVWQLPLIIGAVLAVIVISLAIYALYYTWLVNFFG